MNNILSGSSPTADDFDLVVGTLSFHESGVVSIVRNEYKDIDPLINKTFEMTSDFIFYALQRTDWVIEFSSNYTEESSRQQKEKKPKLTLIPGGKDLE